MTAVVVIGVVAFGVSLLTLFSGFGLGTLLLPVFALFMPVEVAVAATAVVHGANSLFKAILLGRGAPRDVIIRFGIPAIVAAFGGAMVLSALSGREPLATWSFMGREAEVTPVKLIMGGLILVFSMMELLPALRRLRVPARWLPVGGLLSGFFGGLSGHQGALRAAFLSPLKLSPTKFASTQAILAMMVDATRLVVYCSTFLVLGRGEDGVGPIPWPLVIAATTCAFVGAVVGKLLLPKMTMATLHLIIGALLLVVGAALILGIA